MGDDDDECYRLEWRQGLACEERVPMVFGLVRVLLLLVWVLMMMMKMMIMVEQQCSCSLFASFVPFVLSFLIDFSLLLKGNSAAWFTKTEETKSDCCPVFFFCFELGPGEEMTDFKFSNI
jgi:hypothetical protein